MNSTDLFETVDQFISTQFSRDDAALRAVEKSLSAAGIGNISVSSSQGKLLYILALVCKATRILEIGTLGGYSTIWLARALPKGGELITIEYDPNHARIAKENIRRAGLSKVVQVKQGNAQIVLKELEKNKGQLFDLVFIDADKVSYDKYFLQALKLSHPGSLIVADNVVRRGKILQEDDSDENVLGAKRFLQILAKSKKVTATILQTVGAKGHDGMALAVVK